MKFFILLSILLVSSLFGCFETTTPDVEFANRLYSENKEEIDTVVTSLLNAEYYDMLISDSSGTMLTNTPEMGDYKLQTVEISDSNTQKACKHLIDTGIVKFFSKAYSQIKIGVWTKKEVYSYIVYSSNNTPPSVEYSTEEYPMDEEGWYYVIADYNEWRVRQREAGITRPYGGYKGQEDGSVFS